MPLTTTNAKTKRRKNLIELVDANLAGSERQFSKPGAVNRLVGVEDVAPEAAHYLVVNRLAGAHQLVRNQVSLQHVRSAGGEHGCDGRFAAGDAAGQTD